MSEKFEFTAAQQNFLKKKLGIDDMSNVRLIFEVDSINTQGITEDYTNKSAKLSFMMCPCPDGGWSWLCCP
ncbi:hypothetical protein [Muriicola sp. Z0-33]|uniref:hypothetical protein n=1 Tax=Muriicola sp. Z0-33 TaxID=2816957 RepID=UPI002237C9ED|nr:hypothetical protein [Muriicola sp. Z0-33]MCW5515287.1 hypothetical protein [Muriicola sp. Z0-33]